MRTWNTTLRPSRQLLPPPRYNPLALWRVISFPKESLSLFSLWVCIKIFSLPWKLNNPYYHSPYLDTTEWRPFNSRPHYVKPSYKPMYSSPTTKPHYNSRWNFNWLSPLKSLICAKIHTIQSFFRNGRPNLQKPHQKPSYHGI